MFFSLVAGIFYLSTFGVPRSFVNRFENELAARGFDVRVSRIRLDIFHGVNISGVKIYGDDLRTVPVIEAGKIVLLLNPIQWFKGRHGLRGVAIRNGSIRLGVEGDDGYEPALKAIDAKTRLEPGGLRIRRFTAEAFGAKFKCRGFIHLPTPLPSLPGQAGGGNRFDPLRRWMEAQKDWLPRWVKQIRAVTFATPPHVEVEAEVDAGHPSGAHVTLVAEGMGTRCRNVFFDGWTVKGELKEGRLELASLDLKQGASSCHVSGSLDLGSKIVEARLFNNLSPSNWVALLPFDVKEQMARNGISSETAKCEVWLGPAPAREVLEHVAGWFSLERANLLGIWIEKGFAAFKIKGRTASVEKIDMLVGRGRQVGPVKGTLEYHFDSRDYSGQATVHCDPNAFLTVLTSNQAREVSSFLFDQYLPEGEFELSGTVGAPENFKLAGHVRATNFIYSGTAVDWFETPVTLTRGGIMALDPMKVERPEGSVVGRVVFHFDDGFVDVDAVSTANPHEVGRMIGPATDRFLQKFQFEGPVYVAATGRVDYTSNTLTDIRVEVRGEHMGMSNLLADTCSFHLEARQLRVEMTNVAGTAYDGTFTGHALFFPVGDPSNYSYQIQASVTNVDFEKFVKALRRPTEEGESYEGRLSTSFAIAGFFGEGRGDTAEGFGEVRVREGHLFQIRLFGGLSRILTKLYPGLGFVKQKDFNATFTIRNRKVHTNDARLEGNILSVKGRGSYAFNEKLDFKVEVQLLRQGPVGNLLRFVTTPVTKLLEFHLTGTLADPHWRPDNLPKELFLIFD